MITFVQDIPSKSQHTLCHSIARSIKCLYTLHRSYSPFSSFSLYIPIIDGKASLVEGGAAAHKAPLLATPVIILCIYNVLLLSV